jgi:GNAT superfamily N-acetyltransferase
VEGAREATPDDAPVLDALYAAAAAEIAPLRGGTLLLSTRVANDDGRVVVGTIDDVVVGWSRGHIETLADGTRLGVIQDLYADPDARGVGVGEAMLADLVAWFRQQRCQGVDALALPGDRATKNFFEGSGFTARLLVMHHRLADDS